MVQVDDSGTCMQNHSQYVIQRLAEDYKLRQAQSYVWGQAKQEYTHTYAVRVQTVNLTVCTQLKATLWLEYACDHTNVETLQVNNIIEERQSSC